MTKTYNVFFFTDNDRFTTKDEREKTAKLLRSFRSNPSYRLTRKALHHYEVTILHAGLCAVMKLI